MSNTDTRQALARKLVDDFAVAFLYGNVAQRIAAGDAIVAALATQPAQPLDMVLHCPACGMQHIDAPDDRTPDWKNEPHRSHLCHGCGHIWRPADVPTNGVLATRTKGKADSPIATQPAQPSAQGEHQCDRSRQINMDRDRLWEENGIPAAQPEPSAQSEAVAWLVEWKAHGYGPQWWGFNHTPGKNATWCSDANNAIRFARKEDAERMRLHIIAVAGLTGMHEYERSVSVTEHMWEGPCRAN